MHPACQRRAWKERAPKRVTNAPTAFDLGWQYGALRWAAWERGELPPERPCPYRENSREAEDWSRGWRAAVRKFADERIDNC